MIRYRDKRLKYESILKDNSKIKVIRKSMYTKKFVVKVVKGLKVHI